ncbi:MAG: Ig-like domain-containing protein [Agitococcus sp.]|nr:Ig-like domain-containing protein [Agitococcus sp.]
MMVNQWLALSLLTGLLLGCGGGSNDEQTTVNKSPVAQADHFNTLESTSITLAVLLNDVEPESEAMTIQTASVAAAQGVVTVSSDKKTLLFAPKVGFIGDADITYTIADTQSNKASAHVFVSVKALQSLSARQDTTCAVIPSGTVKCWGGSDFGQLGDNDEVMAALTDSSKKFKSAPVTVANLNGIKQVAVGYNHACAISQTGSVSCWGDNSRGQIGDGTTTLRPQATPVVGLSAKVTQLALTYQSSCALLETGAVQCWGGNTQGELGVGQTAKLNQSTSPKSVVLLNNVTIKRLVSGRQHLCGITNSDTLVCWGWNDSGQLGLTDTTARFIPTTVTSVGSGVKQVAAGYGHSCAVRASDTVCWGDNSKGQLGDGTTTSSSLPVVVTDLSGVTELALGKEHSCATKSSNDTMCWGSRQAGQTAQSVSAVLLDKTPVLLTALSGKQSISAGDFHTCSIGSGGAVKCWGKNDLGQLGDDTTATIKESAVVVSVKNLP